MKFCKNLQRVVDISNSEWAPFWTNYKMLKKMIKEIPVLVRSEEKPSANTKGTGSPDSTSCQPGCSVQSLEQDHGDKTGESTASNRKEKLGRNPSEVIFFRLLHSEFKKTTYFFEKAQQEFAIREERVREGMEIMKRPNSIMCNEKWSMLAKSIYRLYKDLLLLETFAIMTYCSFSKILKKHDKVTGHKTREPFMTNVVSKANFTNYPQLLEMISRCMHLYEEVSKRLLQEGKSGLYEDERLFINMISRLNEQALDNADAPPAEEQARRTSQLKFAPSIATSPPCENKPESEQVARLRSLVEENDARLSSHVSESGGQADDAARKKSTHGDNEYKPEAKRAKIDN